jgi:hypothetical protein
MTWIFLPLLESDLGMRQKQFNFAILHNCKFKFSRKKPLMCNKSHIKNTIFGEKENSTWLFKQRTMARIFLPLLEPKSGMQQKWQSCNRTQFQT